MALRGWCIGLVLAGLWAAPAGAEERNDERIENARRQIRVMLERAEELQRAGRIDEAERHRREAEAMREKLEAHLAALRRKPRDADDLERILKGLVQGLEALHKLGGREDACAQLERAIRDVKREIAERQQARREREGEFDRMHHALELAHTAMREAERGDLAEMVERAMHAQRVKAAGRTDEEAHGIVQRAPRPEQLAEILGYAARLYAEWGKPDRADMCANASRRLLGKRGEDERAQAEHGLEVLRIAHHAFREAEKGEWAERMEQAIHAAELRLQGRRDEGAQHVYRTAPRRGEMVELLEAAGQIWNKLGHERRAEACFQLARQWRAKLERPREREAPDLRAIEERLARLERAIEEIEKRLRR